MTTLARQQRIVYAAHGGGVEHWRAEVGGQARLGRVAKKTKTASGDSSSTVMRALATATTAVSVCDSPARTEHRLSLRAFRAPARGFFSVARQPAVGDWR